MERPENIHKRCGKVAARNWIKKIDKLDEGKRWHTASLIKWDYIRGEHVWGKCHRCKKHMRNFCEAIDVYLKDNKPVDRKNEGLRFMTSSEIEASLLAVGYSLMQAIKRADCMARTRKSQINAKGPKY